ncbi:PQQ-dependent sugar dehydrogenase [Desemzia sp. RIT804]|uniref:PQQ-dependent sugar dehydrogenase n=1 Tax=Desemzia sp. RIT 804 TaxID=2810209 RepID=UPI00194E2DE0|nr:PQQ-dependent sugar dehydrogenase [Desemzia sp. RIT 804]MBM6614343.1 PQQ-dependent sugar dehydrogenase [Desemzia sp. RIT 804]
MKKRFLFLLFSLILLVSCTPSEEETTSSSSQTESSSETDQSVTESQEESITVPENFESVTYEIIDAYENLSFNQPLYFTSVNSDSNIVFVVERTGRVYSFENTPTVNEKEVFIDLSDSISLDGSEMGLLGLAFHPEFKENGYFYVNYTTAQGTILSRFEADPTTYETTLDSEVILMEFPQPYSNHNGGHITFGPDGYLYIGTGDGGGSGDPQNNAQSLNEIYGKLLRIDVDTQTNSLPYGIPDDNPFRGNEEGYREEIFAYGLRNPWKFSFDVEREWLWLADVGQDAVEEINLIEAGKNYGWRLMEGTKEYATDETMDDFELERPIWEYDHSQGQSITGGYVYYGEDNSTLKGTYIYGDFVSGKLWALWMNEQESIENIEIADTDAMISSFGLDERGELIIVDFNGKLYRIQESD